MKLLFFIYVRGKQVRSLLEHFGSDPVTRGWCIGYYPKRRTFHEILDENQEVSRKNTKIHILTDTKIRMGLQALADKYPHHLENIFDLDKQDAAAADLFIQCCLFGEEKYA
jgi:hypothetical protein